MTAHTVSATDPIAMDAAFDPKPTAKPAKSAKADNNTMMAGADMYRRMQARPKQKGSAATYLIGGVAAIALIGGGVYFAGQQGQAKPVQTAAANAANANQQAQASNAQAQAAQQSAQASADVAQANKVAETGNPPPAATDTRPARPVRTVTRTRETVVHRTVVARHTQPSASAASAGVDTSAYTPAPPPVTAVQPAPAVPAPAPAVVPAPAPAPTPAPDQTQAQPTTPPQ